MQPIFDTFQGNAFIILLIVSSRQREALSWIGGQAWWRMPSCFQWNLKAEEMELDPGMQRLSCFLPFSWSIQLAVASTFHLTRVHVDLLLNVLVCWLNYGNVQMYLNAEDVNGHETEMASKYSKEIRTWMPRWGHPPSSARPVWDANLYKRLHWFPLLDLVSVWGLFLQTKAP